MDNPHGDGTRVERTLGSPLFYAPDASLFGLFSLTLSLLGLVIGLLLLYLVIRQAVFHGLRVHTRWIHKGTDYEKLR